MVGELKWWMIYSWVALPTVMYGGYALLHLIMDKKNTGFHRSMFRAGHAHAGVLLLMSLLYYDYLDRVGLPAVWQDVGSGLLIFGVLAQSGGFFIYMLKRGRGNLRSARR